MSMATASYLSRQALQKERVRILYRRALKDTLNWAVHRHLFYPDEDIELIDRMIGAGEATHNKWRHPDPYIANFAGTQHHLLGLRLFMTMVAKIMTDVQPHPWK